MLKYKPKQLFSLILAALFTWSGSHNYILAQNSLKLTPKTPTIVEKTTVTNIPEVEIAPELEKNIKASIISVYGEDKLDAVYSNVLKLIKKAREERNDKLKQDDINRSSDWYKDEIVYMFYADQFGVKDKNSANTFEGLIGMLDYLKDLGVTTLYILPFMDSPMGDAGFDVKDPKNVRKDLGGMEEFERFAMIARAKGFKIKADLILNHFSDQHKWFQDALKGDLSKLDYFVATNKAPAYKRYRDENIGIIAEYQEDNGLVSKRRVIFPEICENNYRKVTISGKDYYVYHTFYPFQLDVNWENPEVLYYMLDAIAFWANNGVDIFRLDAIPYFIKEKGTNAENLPKTHDTVQLLSSFLQAIGPRSVLQAEACQWPKDILPYFGEENKIKVNNDKQLTRTDEVQIAYHFPYMPAIWASLVTGDKEHFWKAYQSTPQIPDSSTWAIFLRVHDELTLEMVDIETRKLIYDKLISKGAQFREGFGVSGRIANFLDNDPSKIGLAYSVLLSLPGIPIIYYGDEIGAQNNWEYAKEFAKKREATQKTKGENLEVKSYFDSRDINRGPIEKAMFYNATRNKSDLSNQIYRTIRNLIKVRKENSVLTKGTLTPVKSNQESIFSYLRENDTEQVLVVHNLSDKPVKTTLDLPRDVVNKISKSHLNDLLTNKQVKIKQISSGLKITLKPYQSLWFKL
ncbi:MAG: hypothetical protein A2287_05755 [Candidatus Melainabacteria bacterium RIFOXYA12_FULL_32_12]|nr:MAG: hypothetical protein A2255_05420 [Candidatus Melainabacteria bacterium RIFOXYA2_FULL_32_9]OGI30842.1 MAG: hypothetical protein A2287_05755 [Candidatus Melainabacteria bacterium RIFOXYA12_FULL_32_12]